MKSRLKTQPALKRNVLKKADLKNQTTPGFMKRQTSIYLIIGLSVAGIIAAFLGEPISQDPAYHNFADGRTLFSIPNFWNVISNLPFLVFGLIGFTRVTQQKPNGMFPPLIIAYLLFFTGIFFTGFGSAYYHYAPTNATLFWDRLPMTVAFMAFFSIIIGEFILMKAARKLLLPLLLIGVSSVLYWHFTETAGHGDLRFYLLVQFLPILLIPIIMLLFRSGTNTNLFTWLVILAYLIAKVLETYDSQIFQATQQISGHTLKHLAASLAPLIFLLGLFKRRITNQQEA